MSESAPVPPLPNRITDTIAAWGERRNAAEELGYDPAMQRKRQAGLRNWSMAMVAAGVMTFGASQLFSLLDDDDTAVTKTKNTAYIFTAFSLVLQGFGIAGRTKKYRENMWSLIGKNEPEPCPDSQKIDVEIYRFMKENAPHYPDPCTNTA